MTLPEPWITAINLSFEKPGSAWAKRLPSKMPKTTKNNANNNNRTRRQPPVSKPKDKVLNLKQTMGRPFISTQLEEYQRRASFMSSGSAASSPLVPSPGLAAAVAARSSSPPDAATAAPADLNPNAVPFVPSYPGANDGTTSGSIALSHHNTTALMAKNSKSKGKDVHRGQVSYVYTSAVSAASLENNKVVDVIRRSSQSSTPASAYYATAYDLDMEVYAGWGEGEQSYEYEYDQEYGYEYDFYSSQPHQPHLIHQ